MKGDNAMPKQVICYHHNTIKNKANEILNLKRRDYAEIDSLLADVQALAKDILKSTNLAFADGKNMENRLKLYKKAIEGLGFERKKSN